MIFGFASDICQTKPKWPQLLRRQCYLMPNSTILARKSTSESIHCQSDSMWRWWQYKRNSRILDIKARCLFLNKPKETCRSFPILFLLSGAPSCVTNTEAVFKASVGNNSDFYRCCWQYFSPWQYFSQPCQALFQRPDNANYANYAYWKQLA